MLRIFPDNATIIKATVLPLLPLFPITALLAGAGCAGGCTAPAVLPNLSFLIAPALLAWVAVGTHDVYRLISARLLPLEHRLFAIATGLRVVAGLLVAIGVLVGVMTEAAPAMLVAAATLVVGSTWFDERARAAEPARHEIS